MYKALIFFFFSLWTCSKTTNKIKFEYRTVPSKYYAMRETHNFKLTNDVFDLTSLLPDGYVKDGSVDYTNHLQQGLSKYKNILFPNFPLLVSEKGLTLKSNSNIYFPGKTVLLQNASALKKYEVLRIHNIENVKIYNPKIRGDRYSHKTKSGEWGMGIAIRSSRNVTVFSPEIRDCWGDGIYIGQLKNIPSRNIKIINAVADNNRRNGISITSVTGCQIIRPVVSNTNGTLPMAGIVIEPNSNKDEIENISLDCPVTFNNENYGIVIGLGKLLGPKKHVIDIRVNTHLDEFAATGFFMGGASSVIKKPGKKITGKILFESPSWLTNNEPLRFKTSYERLPKLIIRNAEVWDGRNKNTAYLLSLKEKFRSERNILIN